MRYTYWDKVAVLDGELDDAFLDEAEQFLTADFVKGYIEKEDGSPDFEKNDFYKTEPNHQKDSFLVEKIIGMGIAPIPPEYTVAALLHKCLSGIKKESHFDWHMDGNHSLAVTIYLTDVDGGELQVDNGDDQSILIKPKRGRLVLLKGDTRHRVLPVKSGTRDSIQIFMRFE